MLESLHLQNVGPAPEIEMELAPRLNLITGDKLFTRYRLVGINSSMAAGSKPKDDIWLCCSTN
jgi:hypothetical protein